MITATRTLTIDQNGRPLAVPISIDAPIERGGSWYCSFTIAWPSAPEVGETGGADGIQALFNALQMIGLRIYASPYHASGRLEWGISQGGGYGFPVPKGSRDLLVGNDKRFYG
ncbi:MAG: hypothetical protein P4M09_30690 [Devosia sp.]|nr:hypothetical protein [Devosia sp.]